MTADARGEAVTPLLPAGEYTLTTSASPDRYAEARQQVEVTANAVQVIPVQHVPLGEVSITVYESSVNSAGDATQNVLAGQQVEIHAVDARGNAGERVYADNTLASNRSGLVRDEKDLLPALPEGVYRVSAAGISVDVQIRDAMRTEAQLSVPSETGALRILVKDSIGVQAPLAGARFVLHGATGDEVTLTTGEDGTALVTMLAAGNYSLEQTRAPAGYSGIPQRQVTIAGGELVELEVQNHAYATLRVIKRGISYTAEGTPTQEELSGEYTLYYKLDDMILPYEEDGQPVRVLAGEAVSLPATPAGMTYILREVSKPTPGYLAGEAEPSVALKSGQATDLQVALVADQGFLRVENADASTGAGLSGARFGLYAVQNEKEAAEPTLVFGVQDGVYINEKPLPTGAYVLRMVSAASGYMLDEAVHPIRWDVQIEAISPEAKNIAEVETRSAAIPAEQTTDSARALSVEPAQLASLYEGEQSLRMRLSAADGSSTLPLDDYAVEIGGMMLESGGEWISAEENGDFAWYVTRVTLHPATDQSGKPVTASLWAQGWLGGWREVQDSLDLSEAVMLDLSDEDGGAFTWLRSVRIEYESHDGGVAAGFSGGEIEVEVRLARRYAGMAALSAVQPVASERFAVQYLDEKGRAAHGPQQQADVYGGQLAVAGGEAQPYTTAPDEGKAVLTGRLLMDLEGQAGETGAPGYLVRLKDDDGGIAAQAVSYNGGYYTLEAAPGTYQVEVVAPVASFAQTVLEEVALEAGQTRTADLSVARSTLVRLALVDQTGEPAQLSVALVAADGAEHEAVWSEEGLAVWQSLPLGDYTLRIELPDALMLDKPEWQGAQVQLTTQQWYMDLRVVVRPAAGVRGSLFSDIDGSGTQDAGESGLSGVQVRLLTDLVSQAQPKEVASLTTGGDGSFSFEKLAAGTYALEYTLPAGMVLPQGATQQGTAWRGEAFTLEEGAQETLAAVAAVRPGQLSGSVWLDSDHNGLFEAGETPEEGFVVRLYDLSSDSSLPVQSVKTDDQGAYTFTGLMPGTYQIRVSLSEDRVPTKWVQDGNQLSKTQERAAQTEPIVLRMDETPPKILLGLSIPVELTVFSWLDEQYTGQVSRTAQGIAQVQWELIAQGQEEAGESVSTAVSDASGEAVFTDLGPGVYKLRYVLPEGYYPSIAVDGAIRSEQEQWQSQGETRYFTLSANQAEQRLTFGLMQPVSISGTVWLDADDNALLDAGEAGYAGAVVVALDESGQAAAQAESGADGTYTLSPLSPGRYTVRVTAPEGYVFSGAERSYTRGSVARSDSNISQTMQLELRPQTPLSGIDAGVMPLGSLSGKVVSDEDASQGLGGARVSLEQVVDGVAASTMEAQSAQDGSFAFAALRPGSYRLRIELPGGNVLVRYPERLTLESGVYSSVSQFEVFAFSPGETLEGLEFSGLVLCTLGGYAFDDQNSDGLRNEGEAALRGMTVELLSAGQGAQQEVLANTSTGADGAFSFVGLLPGTYALRVTLPSDRVFTNAAEGGSLPQRSDVQVAYLPSVELSRGQSRMDQIVGALQLAEVSGQVFLDTSDDGRMQSEEQGLSGVLVQAVGKDGTLHAEATSDSVGSWRISGLEPGEYTLRATLPDGQVFARTATREGTPYFTMQDNAEGVSTLFTLSFGQSVRGVHIGAVTTGGIAGRMYDETLEDAAANGIAGAQVTLTNLAGGQTYTQETGDDGVFRLEGLRPGKWSLSIALPGERLFSLNTTTWFGEIEQSSTATVEPLTLGMGQWMENFQIGTLLPVRVAGSVYLDADKSLSRGAEEKGLPGVTVQLIREGQVVAQALTASDGNFAFEKLRPGLLGLSVQIPSQAMLEQGGPLDLAEGSDTTGTLTQRMLNAGEAIESLDIPALQRGLISGMVYEDLNTNGLFDLGEPSIQNVRVDLIDNAQESQILMTQQVDENGRYSFTSLPPGEYTLRFTLPHGYLLAETQDDAAPSQVGMLPPVSLGMGESQTGVQMRAIQTGHIGDTVWIDANGNGLQDDGELPYEGLEIVLYRVQEGAMTEVSRTLSDQYGFYHFNDLYPGTYQVEAVLPEGFAFTGRNENLTEITTAITQIDEKRGFTETFPLESGRHLRSIDIGLMQ